eukprot:340658-Chlamydomonas_euryale.AAC.1
MGSCRGQVGLGCRVAARCLCGSACMGSCRGRGTACVSGGAPAVSTQAGRARFCAMFVSASFVWTHCVVAPREPTAYPRAVDGVCAARCLCCAPAGRCEPVVMWQLQFHTLQCVVCAVHQEGVNL